MSDAREAAGRQVEAESTATPSGRSSPQPDGTNTARTRSRLRRWLAGNGGQRLGGGWAAGVWAVVFTGLLLQAPGRVVFDTKLDVDLTPGTFLGGLARLWNPRQGFGGLQDQAVGYAFPMGPAHLLAEALGIPPWIAERLWMSAVVAAAFWGVVRLTERLGAGNAGTRLTAAAAYALWPTLTSLVGSTSAAVLPLALLPWVLVPLVDGARQGASPPLCAARSAFAVLCMGGVNAVSVLAVLPAPLLYLLTRARGPRRRSLLLWWLGGVLLATAWYWLPLLLLAGYGFDFLPYIETPHTTASTMAATEALRGTGNWLDYLDFGSPALPAGWVLASTGWAVAGTAFVTAAGLGGLALRRLPEARWLRLTAAAGAVAVMAVYPGRLGGPLHSAFQDLLNGPGEAFHSVYKFQPLIALPLAVGVAHLLSRPLPRAPRTRPVVAALLAAALLGAALPYLTGRVLQRGSFTDVPAYWKDTAAFLAGHGGDGRALLEPATSHGTYSWGTTTDDALQPYARSGWVERTLVPTGGAGSQRYLDAAERAMASGGKVPGLAAYLARAGIRYVVVRHDLDPDQFEFVSPALYHRMLQLSGFHQVAGFGPVTPASPIRSGTPLQIQAIDQGYRAVEVYEADDERLRPEDPLTVLPAAGSVQLSGGPESLLGTAELTRDRAVTLTGDGTASGADPLVVTDGLRRADTSFGLIRDNVSYTYTPQDTNPPGRTDGSGGKAPRQLRLPFDESGHQTTAVLSQAASVTASTYGSWLLQSPQYDPVNAFDGDPATAWVEGNAATPVGQWIAIGFGRSLQLTGQVKIRLLADTPFRPVATRITVTTDRGSVTDAVTPDAREQPLRVPAGSTGSLRLTIAAAQGAVAGGFGAGISEVAIPGVKVTRYLRAPHDASTAGPGGAALSFHRRTATPGIIAAADPETSLARVFTLDQGDTFAASLTALPVPGPQLAGLLDSLTPSTGLRVSASPALGDLPQFRAADLTDGSYLTGWIAAPGTTPAVHLSWPGRRTLDELYLKAADGISAPPLSVRITSPDGVREAPVGADGHVAFPALRTDRVELTFPRVKRITVYDQITGTRLPLPLGLAEIHFPALADLRHAPLDPNRPFRLPCGRGPDLTVDGTTYHTSAEGTAGALVEGLPVAVTLCDGQGRLALGAGEHRLFAAGGGVPLALTDATLTGSTAASALGASEPGGGPVRTLSRRVWGDEDRSVSVGGGPAAYLEIHENRAPGWTATLNGRSLRAVTLDGWQQAFVLPAGAGGTVRIHYGPSAAYTASLAIGAVLALLVVAAACGAFGRARGADSPGVGVRPVGEAFGPLLAVPVLFLVGGPMAAAAVLLAVAVRWRAAVAPAVAVTAMTAAGIVSAVAAQDGLAPGRGAFGLPAQGLALTALAAALVPGGGRTAWPWSARGAPVPEGAMGVPGDAAEGDVEGVSATRHGPLAATAPGGSWAPGPEAGA